MKKKKIAIICDDLTVGGFSSLQGTILPFLSGKINITVVCLFAKGEIGRELESKGFEVNCLKINKLNFLLKFVQLILFLRREKIDIVHTNLFYAHAIGQLAAILAGVKKRIAQLHSIETGDKKKSSFFRYFFIGSVHTVISVSKAVKKSFEDYFPDFKGENFVIHNAIDLNRFKSFLKEKEQIDLNVVPGEFVIMSIGSLKWQKGYKFLIDAAEKLKNRKNKFFIVGDGPDKDAIKKMIMEKKLENTVFLLGWRTDIADLLSRTDLFVLPSVSEGFGIVLLEAFAAGVPVIATNVGGIPEVTDGNSCAILVSPENSDILAKKIILLQEDEKMRHFLTKNAFKRLGKFDPEKITEEYEKIFI
ncbi:MAG: glycosyltransferase [Verrucomicrobiota bacterium]|nr:glycosyltransferase [Verrucomicrobiota bacterium]